MYSSLKKEVLPQLIPPNSGILAAISGGPDSVALAHILWRYLKDFPEQNLSLVLTHVNHKVRKEADDEAELVRTLADQWEVPLILHEFNAIENAARCRKSFQEASREWRYARWREDMEKWGSNLLATAHHLGDQAETVLYRLIRGSGTSGLAGIYPYRDKVIRPLLSVTKKDILAYCQTEKLAYYIDASNLEPHYVRNKIRIELLPELEKEYNQKIIEALGRTAEILRWDEEFISSHVEKLWTRFSRVDTDGYLVLNNEAWEQPEAVLSRLLRRAAAEITGKHRGLEYKYIKILMKEGRKTGWRQDLPGIKVESTKEGCLFLQGEAEQIIPQDLDIPLRVQEWCDLPGTEFKAGIFNKMISEKDILWWTEFDCEILEKEYSLVFRRRRPGDRMYFEKLGHKSIKKILQENNISSKKRGLIPLLAYGSKVVWIPGVCRSDSFLPVNRFSQKCYVFVSKTGRDVPILD